MAYLVKPFTQGDLVPAIELAVSRYAEIVTLEAEVADLGERFETRKRVERAKSLLQQAYKLSESDAFRWLQKSAMDRRLIDARGRGRGDPRGRRDRSVKVSARFGPLGHE